jgi:4-hydroxy-tetrahydrodipicolinate reductase
MGREVLALLGGEYATRAKLAAAVDRAAAGSAPSSGLAGGAGADIASLLSVDAVVDFSSPDAVLELVAALTPAPDPLPALVLGSTGWTLDGRAALRSIAERTPLVMSSNFSVGVQLLLEILRTHAPVLEKFGYTPVVTETHHKHKKDSPSGTALSLQRVISPAGPGNVQTHATRAGEVIGDHAVTYYGAADQLVLSHHAQDRSIFARGALDAALWAASRRAGAQPLRGVLGMDAYFKELAR